MKHVYNVAQFESAISQGETNLVLHGDIADKIIKEANEKRKKKKRAVIAGGALAVGGLLAAPFTGGASLVGTAAGLTIGGITITAAELAIIFAGSALLISALKGRNIKVKAIDQQGHTVEIEIS